MTKTLCITILRAYGCFILGLYGCTVLAKGAQIQLSTNTQALKINGNVRVLIVKALTDVKQVHYTLTPNLPEGTQITPQSCGDMLRNATCLLKITPGPTPSNETTTISIEGTNSNKLSAEITVLNYGSRYQQGYVFALNDDLSIYPEAQSVGGQIAALGNNHVATAWSNNQYTLTNATSLTDGLANTKTIIAAYGEGDYAAYHCARYQIDSAGNSPCTTGTCYDNWYLPAVCQVSGADKASGCLGMPSQPNMEENLFNLNSPVGSLLGYYWTSTESLRDQNQTAWVQWFWTNPNKKIPYIVFKGAMPAIRCTRQIA